MSAKEPEDSIVELLTFCVPTSIAKLKRMKNEIENPSIAQFAHSEQVGRLLNLEEPINDLGNSFLKLIDNCRHSVCLGHFTATRISPISTIDEAGKAALTQNIQDTTEQLIKRRLLSEEQRKTILQICEAYLDAHMALRGKFRELREAEQRLERI